MAKKHSSPVYRPEGFRSQRLFVLPSPIKERTQSHPLLQGLQVTDAGVFLQAKNHLINRPQGTDTTLLIGCVTGRGMVRTDQQTYSISPGTVIWLPSGQPHFYKSQTDDPWTIEWVHFCGSEINEWRQMLNIPKQGGTLSMTPEQCAKLNIGEIWTSLEHGYSLANQIVASTALRQTLVKILQQSVVREGTRSAMERIDDSINWLKQRLAQPINLKELAETAGLSPAHYSLLFRQKMGFSPIDWCNHMRVQKACELLSTTNQTIVEIARSVGYQDPFYFSRYFKRIMGLSPLRYRRIPKG